MECFRLLLEHRAWIEHHFLSGIRDSRKVRSLWGMMSVHQSWLAKGLGLELGLLCWGFKGVQEEIPRELASTLPIGSVAFPPGQYTGPQLHPCHRLFEQDGYQDSSSASSDLASYDFWLFSKLLSLWDNWGDERGCDEGHWHTHKRTSMGPFRICWNGTTSTLQP